MIETLWLVILLGGLAAWTIHSNGEYAVFKQLTDSRARSATYLRWTAESFVGLTGASLFTLWLLGRTDALFAIPEAFKALGSGLAHQKPSDDASSGGFLIGLGIGVGMLVLLQYFRLRRAVDAIAGDIEPLLPRNLRERICVLPLCINAGVSEELFFRLALPLLATQVTGSAIVGLGLSVIVFGLAHLYQGWKGVLATMMLGAFFTFHYLDHGSLVWLMAAHALLDVIALIVRPLIANLIAERRSTALPA